MGLNNMAGIKVRQTRDLTLRSPELQCCPKTLSSVQGLTLNGDKNSSLPLPIICIMDSSPGCCLSPPCAQLAESFEGKKTNIYKVSSNVVRAD